MSTACRVLFMGVLLACAALPQATWAQDLPVAADVDIVYDAGYTSLLPSTSSELSVTAEQTIADAQAEVDLGLADLGPTAGDPNTSPYTIKSIITYLRQGGPGNASLRWGTSNGSGGGFGYRKLFSYHNIRDERAMRYLAESRIWDYTKGTSWRGTSYAYLKACSRRTNQCEVVDEVKVLIVVDERRLTDGNNFGVVTGFCEEYQPECPDWVTSALVNAYSRSH